MEKWKIETPNEKKRKSASCNDELSERHTMHEHKFAVGPALPTEEAELNAGICRKTNGGKTLI